MTVRSSTKPILIAGAGIGGLSAAIALARQGIATRVLEQSKDFPSQGAGIQFGPNATRILDHWGVLDHLRPDAVTSDGVMIGNGITGAHLNTVPFGESAEMHYGAPFLLAHRADLHTALLKIARKHKPVSFKMNCQVQGFRQDVDSITARTSTGNISGDGLICADGMWSALRDHVDEGAALRFANKSAWRTLLDADQVPEAVRGAWTRLWLAPKAHLVHYPVCGGSKINVVAVIDDRSMRTDNWQEEANPEDLLPSYENWNSHVAELVRAGTNWRKWSLYSMPPLRNWTTGRVCLLGDAAHPVLPFLAQGGAMAIEDAVVLAEEVGMARQDLASAFKSYEVNRIERTARTSYESRKMGNIYHMGGLPRAMRDFVLRHRKPESLRKRYDWLYGFRAMED